MTLAPFRQSGWALMMAMALASISLTLELKDSQHRNYTVAGDAKRLGPRMLRNAGRLLTCASG
jgi:hypothetical protein